MYVNNHYFSSVYHPTILYSCPIFQLVGISFEIHDNATRSSKENTNGNKSKESGKDARRLAEELSQMRPSCLDIFSYTYCFLGLFLGNVSSAIAEIVVEFVIVIVTI